MVMSSNKIGRRAMKATQAGIDDILKSAPAMVQSDGKAEAELKAAVAPKKAQSFAEAFKAARAKGEKNFTWFGKSYAAKTADEGLKRPTSTGRSGTGSGSSTRSSTPKGPDVNTRTKEFIRAAPLTPKKAEAPKAPTPKAEPKRDNTAAGRRARFADMLGAPGRLATRLYTGLPTGQTPPKGKRNPILKVGDEARKANKGTIGGMKKGGSIDGCAIRGKTRAPMKKGK